jgi:hypothetical protein
MSKSTWQKEIIAGRQCLVPACRDAEEWLGKTKLHQGVLIDPRRPRNIQHHRKLFALLNLAVDNWPEDQPTTVEALLGAIKLSTGHYETITTAKGTYRIPKSINFESLDQSAFEPFYEKAVTIISTVLGVDVETLEQEAA